MLKLYYSFSATEVPNFPDVDELSAASALLENDNEHIVVSDYLDPTDSDKVLQILIVISRMLDLLPALNVERFELVGSESQINNYFTKFRPDSVADYTFKNTQGVSIVKNSQFDSLDQEIRAQAIAVSGRAMQVPILPEGQEPPDVFRYRGMDFLEPETVGPSLDNPGHFYLWRKIKDRLNMMPFGIQVQTIPQARNLAKEYSDQALERKIKAFQRRTARSIGDTSFARLRGLYVAPSE